MAVRDRLVAMVLAAGLLLGMAAWSAVGPWPGIAAAALALVAASAIYRVDQHGRPPGDERRPAPSTTPDAAESHAAASARAG